jgi:hypothetical protein
MLTLEEQLAIDEHTCADFAYNAANDNLEEVFMPRVKELCEGLDYQGAIEYIRLMPESVAKMFCIDHVRHARGDYDKS